MFRNFTTAAILALTVTAAQAGNSVTVRFGDLDLTRAKDAQLLDSRVHAAATLVCGSHGYDLHSLRLEDRLSRDNCIAYVSQTLSAKVLAMSDQSRKFAGK